ncbi:MAG: methyltransferase domain-containing protein [Candidatus Scalindua sp.]|nr:methyltransferase domain-containing protein [Candidatus Scalindua sp.]
MDIQKDIYDKQYLSGYRERVDGYEFARWKALEHLIGKILKLSDSKKVLDYGCGSGLHVGLWKKAFPHADLCFCDISSVALEKLTNKYPEFKERCAEMKGTKAQFGSDLFDVILSIEVMEHVENLDNYLSDVHSLLKPGGFFIWTTPCANRFSIEYVYSAITNQIEKTRDGYIKWKWEDPKHLRRLKSSEIRFKLQNIGFVNTGFRFRSHLFSFVCTKLFRGPLRELGKRMILLDYSLFRKLPNGASMIGFTEKSK